MLLMAERGGFAGGADRHDAVCALGDLPFDQPGIGVLVNAAIRVHRCDQRDP